VKANIPGCMSDWRQKLRAADGRTAQVRRRRDLDSGRGGEQVAHSHEIVGRGCEGEHPADPRHAAMTGLAQEGDGLEPAEGFLDAFAPLLAQPVAGVAASAAVDSRSAASARRAG